MALSGIVFARSFAAAEHKDRALGANLVGALVGAVLQSLSFLFGIKFLLILVACFYAMAMAFLPRTASVAEEPLARAS
jgi:hypothetical protein